MENQAGAQPQGRPAAVALLREPVVALLLAGRLISGAGDTIFELAAYWSVYAATHSRAAVGWLGTVGGLGYLASLATGVLADRLDARRLLIATDLVRAVLALLLVVAGGETRGVVGVALWLMAMFLFTSLGAMFRTGRAALWVRAVPDAVRPTANGLMQSVSGAAQLAGAGLAGALLGFAGVGWALVTDAVAFALSALSLGLVRIPPRPLPEGSRTAVPRVSFVPSFLEGQRTVWGIPLLRRAVGVALLINLAGTSLEVLLAAWVKGLLHAPAAVYGGLGVALVAGTIVAGPTYGAVAYRFGIRLTVGAAVLLMGSALATFSRVDAVAGDGLCLFAFGFGAGIAGTGLTTLMQSTTPKERMGRVGGTTQALSAAANPVGAALVGSALAGVRLPDVFLGAGALMLGAAALWLGLAGVQGRPAAPVGAA
ncbi:MAG: MFS transporter [Firmicutes bacterium]|nr:MFS transporter [Bacillota bacterium]